MEPEKSFEDNLNRAFQFSPKLIAFAAFVGTLLMLIYAIKLISELIQGIRLYVCSRFNCCKTNFVERYGKWAVVTGATDGIGLSIAKELARRGLSIVLVGRNEEKLARTKAMLEAEPGVGEVETVRIDLSDSSLDNFARIRDQIDPDNRDIGILINNAGTYPNEFVRFNRKDMSELLDIANVNMIAPLLMTRMIMPGMIKRGRGMVMNVSSIFGYLTVPYESIYSPTKTFLNAFTRQLQVEYSSHPIDIVLLTPGPVGTQSFAGVAHTESPLWSCPSPDNYANSAVSAMSARCSDYSGCISHGLLKHQAFLFNALGIVQILMPCYLRQVVRHFELSPVPKRKANFETNHDNQLKM